MESEPPRDPEKGEIACSGEESDTRPPSTKNSDLPTDSMVTVRLSDASTTISLSESDEDDATVKISADEVVVAEPPPVEDPEEDATLNTDLPTLDDSAKVPMWRRKSSVSTVSLQEDESTATIRSRSDSSGTLSSHNSAQVDWDELEKSEEQAPRDEGSDEVNGVVTRSGQSLEY